MALIDSGRLKFFLCAAQTAKSAWEKAREALLATDRHDRCAWTQAEEEAEHAFSAYNDKARDVATVVQLLVAQAERLSLMVPKTDSLADENKVLGDWVPASSGETIETLRHEEECDRATLLASAATPTSQPSSDEIRRIAFHP